MGMRSMGASNDRRRTYLHRSSFAPLVRWALDLGVRNERLKLLQVPSITQLVFFFFDILFAIELAS